MAFLRRIALLLIINFLVMMMISVVFSVLAFFGLQVDGVGRYLVLSIVFGFGGSLLSLWLSKFIAKKSYNVKLINPAAANRRELFAYNAVQKMAEEHGIKTPEVGIYGDSTPNAFATGATKNSALVAFSAGLLDRLSEEELAAVAGHEMSHIIQGDMVTMSLILGVVNTFVMFLSYIIARAIDAALRDKKGRGGLGNIGFRITYNVLESVLMLLAYIPIAAYSRKREYRADKGAAKMVGAQNMISALRAIDMPVEAYSSQKAAASIAMINNKRKISIYATHPSIEDRIKALEKM